MEWTIGKTLDLTIGDNHRIDEAIGEETIDAKIMVLEDDKDNRRYQSPELNLGTRNRSTSSVTTNRDRIRCYKCREYDHFANECPNSVMDDSNGYESEGAVLQLIRTDAEIHQNTEGTGPIGEQALFKLIKGKNATTSFLPLTKKGWQIGNNKGIRYIPHKEQKCLTEDLVRHVYKKVEMDKRGTEGQWGNIQLPM